MNITKLFISYRREDSGLLSERIHERLAKAFGEDSVFIDVEDIPPGSDFPTHIKETIASCRLMLVIIGDKWVDLTNVEGERRLDEPGDFVRAEIESGLANDLQLIPVLIDGAKMPSEEELPESIVRLTRRNAMDIRSGAHFDYTVNSLIDFIETTHDIKRTDRACRWEIALLVISIIMTYAGIACGVMFPLQLTNGLAAWTYSDAQELYWRWQLMGAILLGTGPLGIALSRWVCCKRRAHRKGFENGIMVSRRKSPNAMFAFALGLSTFGWGLLALIPAIFLAVRGWRQIANRPAVFFGRKYVVLAVLLSLAGLTVSTAFQYTVYNLVRAYAEMDSAAAALEAGEPDEALEHFNASIRWIPNHRRTYLLEGKAMMQSGDFESAIEVLDSVASAYTSDPFVQSNASNLHAAEIFDLLSEAYGAAGNSEKESETQKIAADFRTRSPGGQSTRFRRVK